VAYEIIFKNRFNNKVTSLLKYLEKEWNKQTAEQFLKKLDKRMSTLKEQPFIGSSSQFVKGVRGILITKHNKLF